MRPLLLALLLAAAPTRAAISYTRFEHPKGDYALEYPSDWRTSVGLQALTLRPPGRDAELVKASVERYPIDASSPKTPQAFVRGVVSESAGVKRVEEREGAEVGGLKAQRLLLVESVALRGDYGEELPGPLRELRLVVPVEGGYYVLTLAGVGPPFDRALPEFERMAARMRLPAKGSKGSR